MNISGLSILLCLLNATLLCLITSCGPSVPPNSKVELSRNSAVSEEFFSSFDAMLAKDPDLGEANLFDLKNLAASSEAFFVAENNAVLINPSSAKKAQELIDTMLSDYNIKAVFDSIIRIVSILFNDSKILDINSVDVSLANNSEIFEIITCDEFIKDPYFFVDMGDAQIMFIESVLDMKKTISGCREITVNNFRNCMKNINDFTRVVNQDLSCSIQNKEQLSQLFRSTLRKSFDEIKQAVDSCIDEKFRNCGFDQDEYFRDSIIDISIKK